MTVGVTDASSPLCECIYL